MRQLPQVSDPNLLVGFATGDDAAVYKLTDELAIVQTVDFFPPIVDDPFTYGEIAVANAVSDVYAMGGTPILGLNIVAFPSDLPIEILGEIMKGASSKATEAGVIIVGGHTIEDEEPKFGMAVTGLIEPKSEVTNAGARPGDKLILTKPIGTGIITTAAKQSEIRSEIMVTAVESMKALNRDASHAMLEVGASACVDVTGFGLIGHLLELVNTSGVSARISRQAVPVLEGCLEFLEKGIAPDGTNRNLISADPHVTWDTLLRKQDKLLLCDAQTSGGLLISIGPSKVDKLIDTLQIGGVDSAAVVGEILVEAPSKGPKIEVVA